jgi:hypothetical protein
MWKECTTMQRYLLAKHAHICLRGDDLIIMDLAHGKYLSLPVAQANSIGGWIEGWPLTAAPGAKSSVLQSLLDKGLLTQDPSQGKPAALPSSSAPRASLRDEARPARLPIRFSHLVRFARASLSAKLTVRLNRLERAVARAQYRKARRASSQTPVDMRGVRELIEVFDRLCPLLFRSKGACLLYSLALLEFLAGYGFYPDWVFGVKVRPFRAHTWLQSQDLVLNDAHGMVADMTPILVV